jgi:hypothetical protein
MPFAGMMPAFSPVVHVVEAHGTDHAHAAIDDVGGVPGATHAHFDDVDVDRRIDEGCERKHGEHFERRHRRAALADALRINHFEVRGNVVVDLNETFGADGLAIQDDALTQRLQMRAGEASGRQPESPQEGIDHTSRRGLAIGSGDVDRWHGAVWITEQFDGQGHPIQSRSNAVFRPALKQGLLDDSEPVVELGAAGIIGGGHGPRVYGGSLPRMGPHDRRS